MGERKFFRFVMGLSQQFQYPVSLIFIESRFHDKRGNLIIDRCAKGIPWITIAIWGWELAGTFAGELGKV